MTGIKTYREKETEKTRGKKRYIERIIEEKEADKEIKEYEEASDPEPLDAPINLGK
jgi:hypothetical protein